MKYRNFANGEEKLSALGLGCMGMSFAYGPTDDVESIATLERSLELGINFWDTADMYGDGANERLISKILVPNRNKIFLATKFGFRWKEDGKSNYFDGSPEYMFQAVEKSLRRLNIETIDLYYAHRIDPNVPVEEMVGAMAELVKQGKVRYLGLSEASAATLRKAHAVHPIAALQSEYSYVTRDVEKEILPTCLELGINFIPYSPLGRGQITNTIDSAKLHETDFRKNLPRFGEKHKNNNDLLVKEFAEIAAGQGCTPAQLALAWVLAKDESIIPIPGTKRRKYLEENVAAVDIKLNESTIKKLEAVLEKYPDVGQRYTDGGMKLVNK